MDLQSGLAAAIDAGVPCPIPVIFFEQMKVYPCLERELKPRGGANEVSPHGRNEGGANDIRYARAYSLLNVNNK